MARRLEPGDLGKRKYWGTAGLIGFLMGMVAMYFTKSDMWLIGGILVGLLGGFLVAAIRGSDEI
jgi:hypothetical protein